MASGVVFGWPLFTALALRGPDVGAQRGDRRDPAGGHRRGRGDPRGRAPAAAASGWRASPAWSPCWSFAATQGAGLQRRRRPDPDRRRAGRDRIRRGRRARARDGRLAGDLLGGGAVARRSRFAIGAIAALGSDLHASGDAWLGFAYVAVVSALLGFFPWYAGLARGGVAKIGQIQLLQPLLTLAWSALLLGEHIGAGHDRRVYRGTCERCGHPADEGDAEQSASLGNVGPVSEAARSRAHLQREGAGHLRGRRGSAAAGRLRPHLHLRRGPPHADPRQGQGADRAHGVLARAHRRRVPEPPDLVHRGPGGVPRPRDAGRAARDGAGRVRRARLHHRLGLEGLPGHRRGLRDRAARRASRSPSSCRSRSSRPPRRPSWATTTRTWTSTAPPRSSATARCSRSCAACRSPIYELGAAHARERGIILADTKFEFGRRADGTIVLGDEVLTPDSSRFWPADGYEPGHGQPSFDKQYVRDWASGSGWDKTPPAPRAAGRRDRAHARALRGRVRAHHRRAVRAPGWSARA